MTGPEDSEAGPRPISVAELLAKNGTIGAPPVGGRRRRRRGNADAVTVAELTGEIPVINDELPAEVDEEPQPAADPGVVEPPEPAVVAEPVETPASGIGSGATATRDAEAEAEYEAHLQAREDDPEPVEFQPRRRKHLSALRDYRPSGTGAERMSPDPLDDDDDDSSVDVAVSADADGDTEVRDVARRGNRPGPEDIDLGDEHDDEHDGGFDDEDAPESGDDTDLDERDDEAHGSPLVHGAWVVGQCVIAVAFGAALFLAFDLLWKWNMIVALVLGVLVILGLAGGVRVVRKTEDIGSTLTAVAVGALVTFGPLALQAS